MTIIGTWRRDRSLVKVVKNFISPVFLVPLFLALASSEFVWSANPSAEIRVVYSSFSGSSVPVWIAQERDLFAKQGVKVNLIFATGRRPTQALVAGEVQFISTAASASIPANVAEARNPNLSRASHLRPLGIF